MGLCKNWGMTTCVNVMFDPMGWGGHHITTRAQNCREFFKQMLHVVRDRIWNFCAADGTETKGSTFGETLSKSGLAAAGPSLYKQRVLGWSLEQQ
jgi:hypothetical protein